MRNLIYTIGAEDRNRTGTEISFRRILSPLRLPVPPPRHDTLLNAMYGFWRRHPDLNWGIEVLQTSALPLGYVATKMERKTRFELATLALARRCSTAELLPLKWCLRAESNCRHEDFQSSALPTELPRRKMATPKGFEPSISAVTGRHVRPLHHGAASGDPRWARTIDTLIKSQVLYRLS